MKVKAQYVTPTEEHMNLLRARWKVCWDDIKEPLGMNASELRHCQMSTVRLFQQILEYPEDPMKPLLLKVLWASHQSAGEML